MLLLGREEKAVDAREIGVDAFVPADRLDPVHCRHLAVMEEPRFVLAAYPDQFRIEIIEFGGERGRRPRRHAAPDRAAYRPKVSRVGKQGVSSGRHRW